MDTEIFKMGQEMHLYYNITGKCNEMCSKCHYWTHNKETVDYIAPNKVAELIKKLNVSKVSISGGEPLLAKKQLLELIELVPFTEIVIITNAVLLDQQFLLNIRPYKIKIMISIDTIDRDKWLFVRGRDTFDVVMHNIDLCIEVLGSNRVMAQSVLAQETIDDIPKVKEFCKKKNIFHSIQNYSIGGFNGEWHVIANMNQKTQSDISCKAFKDNIVIQNDGTIWGCFSQSCIPNCKNPIADLKSNDWFSQLNSQYAKDVRRMMALCNRACKQLNCNK